MTDEAALFQPRDTKAGPTGKPVRIIWLLPVVLFVALAGFLVWGLDPDRDPSEVPSALIGVAIGNAFAHQQGKKLHLADAPPDQQVEAITYCNGTYRVIAKDGSSIEYSEFDLRFKTDSGTDGPPTGIPAVINAGMRGDRGFVVFSNPGEISAFIRTEC